MMFMVVPSGSEVWEVRQGGFETPPTTWVDDVVLEEGEPADYLKHGTLATDGGNNAYAITMSRRIGIAEWALGSLTALLMSKVVFADKPILVTELRSALAAANRPLHLSEVHRRLVNWFEPHVVSLEAATHATQFDAVR